MSTTTYLVDEAQEILDRALPPRCEQGVQVFWRIVRRCRNTAELAAATARELDAGEGRCLWSRTARTQLVAILPLGGSGRAS